MFKKILVALSLFISTPAMAYDFAKPDCVYDSKYFDTLTTEGYQEVLITIDPKNNKVKHGILYNLKTHTMIFLSFDIENDKLCVDYTGIKTSFDSSKDGLMAFRNMLDQILGDNLDELKKQVGG